MRIVQNFFRVAIVFFLLFMMKTFMPMPTASLAMPKVAVQTNALSAVNAVAFRPPLLQGATPTTTVTISDTATPQVTDTPAITDTATETPTPLPTETAPSTTTVEAPTPIITGTEAATDTPTVAPPTLAITETATVTNPVETATETPTETPTTLPAATDTTVATPTPSTLPTTGEGNSLNPLIWLWIGLAFFLVVGMERLLRRTYHALLITIFQPLTYASDEADNEVG